MRQRFSCTNLSSVRLSGAVLTREVLSNSNLSGASLHGAKLNQADINNIGSGLYVYFLTRPQHAVWLYRAVRIAIVMVLASVLLWLLM